MEDTSTIGRKSPVPSQVFYDDDDGNNNKCGNPEEFEEIICSESRREKRNSITNANLNSRLAQNYNNTLVRVHTPMDMVVAMNGGSHYGPIIGPPIVNTNNVFLDTGHMVNVDLGSNKAPENVKASSSTSSRRKRNSVNNVTLPSNIAIPVGLSQVFVGLSMVLCGVFALRYQSYLFYYGSGLWAGTLAGVAGILGVMATKKGLKKPSWLCGGRKWQIHIFLMAVMLALCTSILAAILSTSGLIRDTQRDLSQDLEDMTADEEMHEKRKSSGILINALLLLLSMLQILLSFCSLGVALRVFCTRAYCSHNGSLLSSDGSEVTVRDILGDGTGPEYEARKDRLLRWLGHQRRHFFAGQSKAAIMAAKGRHHTNTLLSNASNGKGASNATFDPRLIPTFLASNQRSRSRSRSRSATQQPYHQVIHPSPQYNYNSLPYVIPANYGARNPCPPVILGPQSLPMVAPFPYPAQLVVPLPLMPLPLRQPRPQTPMSLRSGSGSGARSRRGIFGGGPRSISGSSVGGISKRSSQYGTRSRKSRKEKIEKNLKNKKNIEPEITEEEVGRTYTGLDRQVAEDFISSSMNSH